MKKNLFILCACVLMITACDNGKTSKAVKERDSLMSVLNQRDMEMDEMFATLNSIQEGFNQINEAEGRVNLASGENTQTGREKLESDMTFIINKLAENKAQIEKLQKQINSNAINSKELKRTVEKLTKELQEKSAQIVELQKELDAKNIHIAQLDSTINVLNEDINTLKSESETKDKIVDAQDKMINKAWYVFGTKKELKNHKILDDGEALKNGDFDKEYFTEIDIRDVKEIPLVSKRVSVKTTHPEGSYELKKDNKGQYVLVILDANKFWSVSRYLVVQVR